jgi:hypothetical protein
MDDLRTQIIEILKLYGAWAYEKQLMRPGFEV